MRIFTISDLHIDYSENRQWLENISASDYTRDILILAGDLTDNRSRLIEAFTILSQRFHAVFFVPGNHDLWIRDATQKDSLQAFFDIMQIASDHGLLTEPRTFGTTAIIPLLGWYDFSFGQPSVGLKRAWVDFAACKWPDGHTPESITHYFIQLNEKHLAIQSKKKITFSHFLPRIDMIPFFVPKQVKELFPVMGTRLLEEQIRILKPRIHIYGHSHFNRNVKFNGIHYINNAYGYPNESRITAKKLLSIGKV